MACPACSRRALSLFVESVGGLNSANTLLLRPRRLPPTSAPPPLRQHARPRALSTRPALRAPDPSFRLPDIRHGDGAAAENHSSRDAIVPSNLSPEPSVTTPHQHGEVDAITTSDESHVVGSADVAADPDLAELRADLGLTQGPREEDLQAKIWKLTGGLSGTPAEKEAKPGRKARKERKKLERALERAQKREQGGSEEAGASSGEHSEKKTVAPKAVAEIVVKGGYPRVTAYDEVKRKSSIKLEPWRIQKEALKEKFGEEGWQPRKKLSPDAMEGIRTLHKSDPGRFSTPVLADEFKVSPEAIRRILRSKWRPSEEQEEERMKRWEKRGEKIWEAQVAKGMKPPKKWRVKGVGSVHSKEDMPAWKKKKALKRSDWREQSDEPSGSVSDFSRPRGAGVDYGDVGGWSDRIL
ncbi:mitochondrion organization and biogenesis protein [Diplodia corticola]|uniref:Required for respiratory growth protein 9, mitochondrial n=1 Tax=Diplodia corticola TaxID=236234 RepID=A0A1J9S8P5_9PEZI|nr:mitochondrion organization and biogenesis protein [Diplodia corticola]OJD35957.1 mitochondrion organization and biogenesis protein [Diplodia corticola]